MKNFRVYEYGEFRECSAIIYGSNQCCGSDQICSDPDLGSRVHSDLDSKPNRIQINFNPDPMKIFLILLKSKLSPF